MSVPEDSKQAVFLDRDGVLNRSLVRDGKPYPPNSLDELEILPGVEDACGSLKNARFILVCVTNQPDLARGTQSLEVVEEINQTLKEKLGLDDVRVCPHDGADGCDCRKPKPGHLLDAARDFDIDLTSSIMVGDRWRDIEAGQNAGCRTVFIDYGYDEQQPIDPDHVCSDLQGAVSWILENTNNER
ncbi:MAG: HAD family hydrolase [Rhodospirillaceae bacterium]|jgi:D-glycero-D-manno-heptose 1,7-bisphosphate phosphatase|nr:HAD family hydrolase [Rhodospirillales bacterium]MBT3906723.1 HAD family hydrolase [Rhodospirillaceae bacterium]MBT4702738.1 HAD family hydrolase [Rhodospirillaceae bacterium]MBT5033485.1 HAD family hydrolase [Rhodospirillaceae bacterium]MBT6221321.1 HAD family hydrolase [Rhodospirillaceae bacterium]